MRFLHWLKEETSDKRRRPSRSRSPTPPEDFPKGDFRGSYGFGRRAHRPDPQAHYVFEENAARPRRETESR
jgi:hypothetical protein